MSVMSNAGTPIAEVEIRKIELEYEIIKMKLKHEQNAEVRMFLMKLAQVGSYISFALIGGKEIIAVVLSALLQIQFGG